MPPIPEQPRQTDIEDYFHYQNDPDFIGPRLPTEHPAYWRYLASQLFRQPEPDRAGDTTELERMLP